MLVIAVVIAGMVALVWLANGRSKHAMPHASTAADAGSAEPTPPTPGKAPGKAPVPSVPPVPPVPPQALDRDNEVRTKIDAVLDRYPDVATLKTLECQPTGACRIEIEVDDLSNFRAPMELLQDPESGLSGDHALMVLSKPVPLGPNGTAPYLFTFQLTPPEGGVVKP